MAMAIKGCPLLSGDDAERFFEEFEKNNNLPSPQLSKSEKEYVDAVLNSGKKIIFPPQSWFLVSLYLKILSFSPTPKIL